MTSFQKHLQLFSLPSTYRLLSLLPKTHWHTATCILQMRKLIFKCIQYLVQGLTARKQRNGIWTKALLLHSLCSFQDTGEWMHEKPCFHMFKCLLKVYWLLGSRTHTVRLPEAHWSPSPLLWGFTPLWQSFLVIKCNYLTINGSILQIMSTDVANVSVQYPTITQKAFMSNRSNGQIN